MGALTRHASECGAGSGVFFLLHRCLTVLLRGPYAAYWMSPYVDEHGEEDHGLKRGRPLHLSTERRASDYCSRLSQAHQCCAVVQIWAIHDPMNCVIVRMSQISRLWVNHALAGEIIRERMVSDGVIRESWY